jgi:hypothetical protein
MLESPCSIDFNLDDTRSSMVAFLSRISPILRELDSGSPTLRELDLRRCRFLGPSASATIASIHRLASTTGRRWAVRLPEGPEKLLAFCEFSGLRSLIEGSPPPLDENPASETIPLFFIQGPPTGQAERLVRLVARHSDLSDENAEYLRIGFNEMVQNVADHGGSPIGCAACARFIASRGQVVVAIVDRGVGIPRKIRSSHPEIPTASEALRRVLLGGISSKSRPNNAGQGISNLAQFSRTLGGGLWIISESAWISTREGEPLRRGEPKDWCFSGTAVFFTLRVSEPQTPNRS